MCFYLKIYLFLLKMTYSCSLLNKDTQMSRLMLAGVMLLCNLILNYSGPTLNFYMLLFREYDLQSQHIVTCWMSWPSILTILQLLSISRNFHFTNLSKMNRLELCSLNTMSKSLVFNISYICIQANIHKLGFVQFWFVCDTESENATAI